MRQLLIYFLFCSCLSFAQVTFIDVPNEFEMFARDADNRGRFLVKGIAEKNLKVRSVLVETLSDIVLQNDSVDVKAGATFTIAHSIEAKLSEHRLEIYVHPEGGIEKLYYKVGRLLAGDFFIVMGQSNAECGWSTGGNSYDQTYSHEHTRAIGGNFSWAITLNAKKKFQNPIENDCRFGRPHSSFTADYFSGYSGIWPIKIQSELAKKTGIPNCMVNGSVGSSSIYQNFPSHTPSDPDSLQHTPGLIDNRPALPYDRVYKKLHANDAAKGVKAIFWYQGETDGIFDLDSSRNYIRRFNTLYNAWKADYPNVKKIFVMQINLGCGDVNHSLIREIQRKLPEIYPDVVVMSTVGSSLSDRLTDMCHYSIKGYEKIADKLIPVVSKYIYDQELSDDLIMPPNIEECHFSKSNQLCLRFDKKVFVQEKCEYVEAPYLGTAYMKDYFYDQNKTPLNISSIETENNLVFLNLKTEKNDITSVTYLPVAFSLIPSLYSGPWILNAENKEIGAYSFYEFPVNTFVGLGDPQLTLHIFPNPVKERMEINISNSEDHEIRIMDVTGKILFTRRSASEKEIIDVTSYPEGIYFMELSSSKNIIRKKFVVVI